MSIKTLSKRKREALLEQYRQIQENQRKLLELFWTEPSVIIAIAGGIVLASYYYITNTNCLIFEYQVLRTFLIVFGMFMAFSSLLTAIKHRFFRSIWLDKLREIENSLDISPVKMFTKESTHHRGRNYFWENWSAEVVLIISLLFIFVAFAILAIYNVYVTREMLFQISFPWKFHSPLFPLNFAFGL